MLHSVTHIVSIIILMEVCIILSSISTPALHESEERTVHFPRKNMNVGISKRMHQLPAKDIPYSTIPYSKLELNRSRRKQRIWRRGCYKTIGKPMSPVQIDSQRSNYPYLNKRKLKRNMNDCHYMRKENTLKKYSEHESPSQWMSYNGRLRRTPIEEGNDTKVTNHDMEDNKSNMHSTTTEAPLQHQSTNQNTKLVDNSKELAKKFMNMNQKTIAASTSTEATISTEATVSTTAVPNTCPSIEKLLHNEKEVKTTDTKTINNAENKTDKNAENKTDNNAENKNAENKTDNNAENKTDKNADNKTDNIAGNNTDKNVSTMLVQITKDIKEIKLQSEQPKNTTDEDAGLGLPCSAIGAWVSEAGGVQLIIKQNAMKGLLDVDFHDLTPPKKGFLSPLWKVAGEIPFFRHRESTNQTEEPKAEDILGEPFILTATVISDLSDSGDKKIAVFLGECHTCDKGVETVVGSWSVRRPSKDCRDSFISQNEIKDVFHKDILHEKLKTKSKRMYKRNRIKRKKGELAKQNFRKLKHRKEAAFHQYF